MPQPGRAKAGFNAGQLTMEVAISAPQYTDAPKGASEGWFAQDHVNPPSMRKSGVWGKDRATELQSLRTVGPSPDPAVTVPRHRGAQGLTGSWGWGRTIPHFVSHLPSKLLNYAWIAPNEKELMLIPSL